MFVLFQVKQTFFPGAGWKDKWTQSQHTKIVWKGEMHNETNEILKKCIQSDEFMHANVWFYCFKQHFGTSILF